MPSRLLYGTLEHGKNNLRTTNTCRSYIWCLALPSRTYQEGTCSRRRLIFTSEQTIYECNMKSIHKSIQPNLMPNDASLIGVFKGGMQTVHQTLATHLEAYSKRQLTYQSDALNAIHGILVS
jgi:hypothetical protein